MSDTHRAHHEEGITPDVSASMQEKSPSTKAGGAAKAARKRAESLSPEQRSSIARKAAITRWNSADSDDMPKEEYPGRLVFDDLEIECAVLSDGRRVLSERSVTKALNGKRGGSHWQRQKSLLDEGDYVPVFISASNIVPHMSASLKLALAQPVRYKTKRGGKANGVVASLLPEICKAWIVAKRRGAVTASQEHIVEAAEILLSGLAEVGIVALVDEATGYQSVRDRHELQRILEAYVAQQYLPWTLRFPQEFYQELFRLRKWDWNPDSNKRPKRVGKDTEEIIYDRLPIGVKEKLRENNPEIRPGYRRYAHHQFLSGDIGNPHLERLVAVVTALMKISPSWQSFKKKLNKAVPLPEYPDCTGQIDMAEIEPSFARPLAVFEYDDDEFENE